MNVVQPGSARAAMKMVQPGCAQADIHLLYAYLSAPPKHGPMRSIVLYTHAALCTYSITRSLSCC